MGPLNTGEFASIPDDRKLTWLEAYRIRRAVSEFEAVFSAELPTIDSYVASKKGIYSTADLVERSEMALDESARISPLLSFPALPYNRLTFSKLCPAAANNSSEMIRSCSMSSVVHSDSGRGL